MISEHVYSNLLRRSPVNRLVPDLAEGYEVAGPTTFVFRLRRGIRFHHGRELTSDDVKFTFERMIDQRTASPWRSIWLIIERIETPDQHTVRFTTRRPFAPFLSYLGTPHYSAIVPRDVVERSGDLQQTASGTGPFIPARAAIRRSASRRRSPHWQSWARGSARNREASTRPMGSSSHWGRTRASSTRRWTSTPSAASRGTSTARANR
jgi:ABC-type transport system substrate-binding protein